MEEDHIEATSKPIYTDLNTVSIAVYRLVVVVISLGLLLSWYVDARYSNFLINHINNGTMALAIIVMTILQKRGQMSQTSVMGVMFFMVAYVFYAGSTVTISDPVVFRGDYFLATSVALAFMAISSLLVSKYFAAFLTAFNTLVAILLSILSGSQALLQTLPILVVIHLGFGAVMIAYRSRLERLSFKLNGSLTALNLRSLENLRLKEQAEALNRENERFVIAGKSMANIIHDFKGSYAKVDMKIQMLRGVANRGDVIDPSDLDVLRRYAQDLSSRISNFLKVAGADPRLDPEKIEVISIAEGVFHTLKASDQWKGKINFIATLDHGFTIIARRFDLVSLLENAIKNSCEALVDQLEAGHQSNRGAPEVHIYTEALPGGDRLVIADNGPGISFCFDCDQDNCLDCEAIQYGKSTKNYGSGIGLSSMVENSKRINAQLKIQSGRDRGTAIVLDFLTQERD